MLDPNITLSIDNGGLNWQTILTIIAAATAFVSGIVGPYVAFRIARHQIRSSASLAIRKEWIESLTKNVSRFAACAVRVNMITVDVRTGPPDMHAAFNLVDELVELFSQVQIRLDHGDEQGDALVAMMDKAITTAKQDGDIQENIDAIIAQTQKITSFHRNQLTS